MVRKRGYHTTWEGNLCHYRSTYELDYMKELDAQFIPYDYEALKIPYFDSTKNTMRTAIPDFYLPETKTIVEVKSIHTYERQNMIDRSCEYKRLGFNFLLILEHIEFDYCV